MTPTQPQTIIPLVSPTTVTGSASALATMNWSGGPTTLALFALAPGQSAATATPTPVTLGCTVNVAWTNNSFVLTVTPPAEPGTTITVSFSPGIPASSSLVLVVPPGSIQVAVPASLSSLVLTPNMSPTVNVQFGTPYQPGTPAASDFSATVPVSFTGTTAMAAAIIVGPDNVIVPQTS